MASVRPKSAKTRTMSFRIPEDLGEAFETEESVKKITPSNLLTQLLRHQYKI